MNAWHLSSLFLTHIANNLKIIMQSQGFCMGWFSLNLFVCVCVCVPNPYLFLSDLPCEPHSLASSHTLSFLEGRGCFSWLWNRHHHLCDLGKGSRSRSLPRPPGPHRSDSNSVGTHHLTSWWNRYHMHCAGVSHCWAPADLPEIITRNEKACVLVFFLTF